MINPITAVLVISLAQPTVPCPPKTTTCAQGVCVPLGAVCPSTTETAIADEEPSQRFVETPPRAAEPEAVDAAACLESADDLQARKSRRIIGFSLGSLALSGIGVGVLFGTRQAIPANELPDLPNCVNSKPCGRSCISYDKTCDVGQEPTMRMTTAGIVSALVFATAALGLLIGGLVSANRMQRRASSTCSLSGCSIAVRF